MEIINLGIVAHVDAGKTSLTERILYEAGVISRVGRVDHGDTQTDTLALERERGITISSAVVSFQIGDLKVNLIDTPGHPDFIAEVERSLRVLDAVVLVVSAVEGVQAQTHRLAQAILEINLPRLVFINKIDRRGARDSALLEEIRRRLRLAVIPVNAPIDPGEPYAAVSPNESNGDWWIELADLLAESSDDVLRAYVETDGSPDRPLLEREFRRLVGNGSVTPVFFGSAMTGAGVQDLLSGIGRLLPASDIPIDSAAGGRVFKIQRTGNGEKVALARIDAGELSVRERVPVFRPSGHGWRETAEEKITAIDRFCSGKRLPAESASAGDIACLHGLRSVMIGDRIGVGEAPLARADARFAPPPLVSVIDAADPGQQTALAVALQQLSEQDPLIDVRLDDAHAGLTINLYGEVQKEVIADWLARDYGIEARFCETQTRCVERPHGTGLSIERIGEPGNPFFATIGIRIEPGEPGSGIIYRQHFGSMPLAFYRITEETVLAALQHGYYGWAVTDCLVTLVEAGFCAPVSTGTDYRRLVPLVVAAALRAAESIVCEPIDRFSLEIPADVVGAVLSALVQARATTRTIDLNGDSSIITGVMPAAEAQAFEQRLPGVSRGEGFWTSTFYSYAPVPQPAPVRTRPRPDPFNRKAYLADVSQL